jgi:HAD superfamily hydrolase (TIGR01509 family)
MTSNPRIYDAVTLDMGFTLVSLESGYDRELIRLAARAGLAHSVDDVREAWNRLWVTQIALDETRRWDPSPEADLRMALDVDNAICAELGIHDAELRAEAHRIARDLFHRPSSFRIYPEVRETLAALRATGVTLGIVSNWGWRLPELCEQLELEPFFDFIVTSARVGANKPHPAIFEAAVALSGARPDRMLHVGDSLQADVHGAMGAGITGVLIDRSGRAEPHGYPVIHSLDGVLDLLAPAGR